MNLSYVLRRIRKIDYRRMRETIKVIQERSGKSLPWLLWDMSRCAVRYNAGYMDYKIADMYKLDDTQRRTVITRGLSNEIVRRMNNKAYWHFFDDKTEFDTLFAQQVARPWMALDASTTPAQLLTFLQKCDDIIAKPLEGSSGVGIAKYHTADWLDKPDALLQTLHQNNTGILERVVIQHPAMASLCPTSVNTVRIATLLGDKQEGIVYAFLRIGNGKVMDNVDCGGMAARVDLDTGMLKTVGADKAGHVYKKHPMTGTPIVGFTIPFWEEAKAMTLSAMHVVPQVRFVAWDVAITPTGPVFIEGNSFPSHAVPQFSAHYPDGIGIMPRFRAFIDI